MIIDDEPALRHALRTSLPPSEFEVAEARNGEEGLLAAEESAPDLILLDINMPGLNGFEVCRRLRESSPKAGIVMVTVRDTEEDKVQALEAGADDFVTKPYRLRELVARLQAVLRRTAATLHPAPKHLYAGELAIDLEHRILTKRGTEIHLSPKEFDLLAYLFRHAEGAILHSKLLQAVWGPEFGSELEYLRSYIRALRKKIEDDPSRPNYIVTEPWVGYRFRVPASLELPVEPGLDI